MPLPPLRALASSSTAVILSVRVVEQISLSHEGTMETFIYRNGYLRTSSRKFTMDMKACKGRLLDEVRQRGTCA